jgi:hypothetical protein
MMDITKHLQLVASGATAIGVVVAAVQLWLTKKQAVTTFEDQVSNEYRQIAKAIPVKALLGENLIEDEFEHALNDLYNYIDFTNEQVFLRQHGRIGSKTWKNWQEGIEWNMRLPAFEKAWQLIKSKLPDSFTELRKLEQEKYASDPRKW